MIQEMNSRELHRLEYIAALDAQLQGAEDPLKARLQTIPNGWRDFRMVVTRTGRLVRELYETVPTSTLKHFNALMQHGEVVIRMKPCDNRSECTMLQTSDLRLLLNTIMTDECAICLKDRAETKGCKLRKTLMNIAPPKELLKSGECPYRNVAVNSELGNYVG